MTDIDKRWIVKRRPMSEYDQYKESAFTHEEMQPMIIETDMTDIVERLREQPKMSIFANIGDMVGRLNHEREEAADEIERLRAVLRNVSKSKCEICCQYGRLHDIARAALGEKE